MAVLSTMAPLGTKASNFNLLDTISHKKLSLSDVKGEKATVIMFLCNHCPYVKHILPALVTFITEYQTQGVSFVAISANDINAYPEDSPKEMTKLAKSKNFTFPYLYDESQNVARAYDAACTPDFFVFDNHLHSVYRGRFDDSTPGNKHRITGNDLRLALDNVLQGKPNIEEQQPSMGCSIKWK